MYLFRNKQLNIYEVIVALSNGKGNVAFFPCSSHGA